MTYIAGSDADSPETRYWRDTHRRTPDALGTVCHPGRDAIRYQGCFQRLAVSRALQRESLDLGGKSVLDIGTWTGRWLWYYDSLGAECVSLDLSLDALEVTISAQSGSKVVQGSTTDFPFAAESFDLVTSITVLMHVPASLHEDAVTELSRTVKPGGFILLLESTWNGPAAIVFGRSVDDWISIFSQHGWSPCTIEGHFPHVPFRTADRLASRLPRLRSGLADMLVSIIGYPNRARATRHETREAVSSRVAASVPAAESLSTEELRGGVAPGYRRLRRRCACRVPARTGWSDATRRIEIGRLR